MVTAVFRLKSRKATQQSAAPCEELKDKAAARSDPDTCPEVSAMPEDYGTENQSLANNEQVSVPLPPSSCAVKKACFDVQDAQLACKDCQCNESPAQ